MTWLLFCMYVDISSSKLVAAQRFYCNEIQPASWTLSYFLTKPPYHHITYLSSTIWRQVANTRAIDNSRPFRLRGCVPVRCLPVCSRRWGHYQGHLSPPHTHTHTLRELRVRSAGMFAHLVSTTRRRGGRRLAGSYSTQIASPGRYRRPEGRRRTPSGSRAGPAGRAQLARSTLELAVAALIV